MSIAKRLLVIAGLALACATAAQAQPVFTSPTNTTGYAGVPFRYQIIASGAASFTCSGLPWFGLDLTDPMQGLITGTPSVVGTNVVQLNALDSSGTTTLASTNLTILILPATPSPQIVSPATGTAIVGQFFQYQILVTNVGVSGYTATPRPAWLSFNAASGLLSGTPITTGSATLTLSAWNETSVPGSAALTITVQPASVGTTTNTIFSENFEGNFPSGWQVGDANASGTPAYWAAVTGPFGGVSAAGGSRMAYCAGIGYAGTSDNPTYRNDMSAYMQRTLDLSGSSAATLTFQSRIAGIETGFDTCRVLVNGTTVWQKSAASSAWILETVPLNDYAGKSGVTLRFEFDSDDSMTATGWFLDDVRVGTAQGDRFDVGTVIGRGTNHAGSVASKNALDVSRVTLRKGYTYTITATPGSLIDPQMWLFDANRIQLAYNDDASGLGLGSRITFICAATGEYFVQVGGVSGASGSYTLLVAEQAASADIRAVAVALTLPDVVDSRGLSPTSLVFTVQNNGPFRLDNGEAYSYLVEVYLSPNGASAGTGERIGSETIQLALAWGASVTTTATLANYAIPADLPAGNYYPWLHITPLGGAPADPNSANNWVAGAKTNLPPPSTVTIAGIVTKSGSTSGKPNATITLVSSDGTSTNQALTDSYGNYSVPVSNGWTGTMRPSDTNGGGGAFSPPVRTYTNGVTNNLVSQNFSWVPPPLIAGKVTKSGTGMAGVVLTLAGNDGTTRTATTDANGNYSVTVSNYWSGRVVPSNGLAGAFSPTGRSYTNVAVNVTAQNYTWGAAPVISGRITKSGTSTGVTNVVVTFTGSGITLTTTTTTNGAYSVVVPYNWTGTVTPSNTGGCGFSPASKTYSKLTANATGQNFSWIPPPMIAGKITRSGTGKGAAGVRVVFAPGGTVLTDANGNYSNTVAYGWSGRATPSSTNGGTFSPTYKAYTKLTANSTGQNYTWAAPAGAALPAAPKAAAGTTTTVDADPAPRRLLHATGLVRWTGADAAQARRSPDLLHIAIADGAVQVDPAVSVAAAGDLVSALEFVDDLPGLCGIVEGDLVVIRNVNGMAVAETPLADAALVDAVLLLTRHGEVVLTWDLLLLRP